MAESNRQIELKLKLIKQVGAETADTIEELVDEMIRRHARRSRDPRLHHHQ